MELVGMIILFTAAIATAIAFFFVYYLYTAVGEETKRALKRSKIQREIYWDRILQPHRRDEWGLLFRVVDNREEYIRKRIAHDEANQ